MQFGGTKLVKEIHQSNKGLIDGINKLADAVGSTLGASGRTVVLEDDFGNAHVTKDGVTVAESINLQDPIENLGCTMMKQASKQTATKAGDGTTTSTVIAQAIINEYINQKGDTHSFRDVRKGIEDTAAQLIKYVDRRAVKVDDKKLEYVSTISANNDKALGLLISDAFKAAGEHGVVTMETSQSGETYVDVVNGTQINSTTKSPHFHTNREKEQAELIEPLIFLCANPVQNVRKIQNILEHAIKSDKAILLVADLESQPLSALAMNKVKGNIKVNVIDPPSFGLKRKDILDDLALLSGAKVIDESLGDALDLITPDCLGQASKVISDKDGTVFVFDSKADEVQEQIDELRKSLSETDHHALRHHLESRLALLCGGVSQIFVGGETEVELKEKKDRVDDAIHAVKAAKKEGILPGGGSALYFATNNVKVKGNQGYLTGAQIMIEAALSPIKKILDNGGLSLDSFTSDLSGFGKGVDVVDGSVKDMRRAGIIDPVMVTKSAIKNAVSVSTTILSTDAVISNVRD